MHLYSVLSLSFVIITFFCIKNANCWESYELDLFDLVEEVGKNFYEVLGVDPKCDFNDIRKAYKKLSLQYHPDKNADPNAESIFRQIVSIYEVLKDNEKRSRYDEILEFGMPDWRMPIYYYRRVRKLSFLETLAALAIIISIGHYFVMWAQYFETRLTWGERIDEARKRLEKKAKKKKDASEMAEIESNLQQFYDSIPSPSLKKTLPCRAAIFLFKFTTTSLPWLIKCYYKRHFVKKQQVKPEEEPVPVATISKKDTENLHKQLNPQKIEKSNLSKRVLEYDQQPEQQQSQPHSSLDAENNIEWTEKQKSDLIKAIAKFPAGSIDRWNKIADFVGRPVKQCIQMEKLAKSNFNYQQQSINLIKKSTSPDSEKVKLNDADQENSEDKWTQEEQVLLENALKQFKKELGPERWDKVASAVGTKNKDQCVRRFKDLCASLKKS